MALTHYEINKKWRKKNNNIWQKGKKRYYDKSIKTAYNEKQEWTIKDINLIMIRKDTDSNLSKQIGRSVKAIQIKRSRIKNNIMKMYRTKGGYYEKNIR